MKVQRGINHDDSWQVSSTAYDVRVLKLFAPGLVVYCTCFKLSVLLRLLHVCHSNVASNPLGICQGHFIVYAVVITKKKKKKTKEKRSNRLVRSVANSDIYFAKLLKSYDNHDCRKRNSKLFSQFGTCCFVG